MHLSKPHIAVGLVVMVTLVGYAWNLGLRPFHLAPFGGRHDATPIDLNAEPTQENLAPQDPKSIIVKNHGAVAVVEPQRRYAVAGRVVLADLYYTDAMSVVSPTDISLIWGHIATDPEALKGVSFHHYLRFGAYQWSPPASPDIEMMRSHFSNNHLIPATPRIKQALTSISQGDAVLLSGYLVNVTAAPTAGGAAFQAQSSLTRDDTGAGACEIVYVDKVRINSTWY